MGDVVRARSATKNPLKSPAAIAGIVLAFLAVIGFGAYLGFKNARHRSEEREVETAPPVEEPPPTELVYAYQVLEGRELLPVLETDAKGATGRRHFRITREKRKVTLIEQVGPAGNVEFKWEVTTHEDGGREVRVRDSRHILLETRELAADGMATRLERRGARILRGCARVKWEFDAAGVPVQSACLDAAGEPAIDLQGCEVVREGYDDRKLLSTSACFSARGDARLDSAFVHRVRYERDARGNAVKTSFFDTNDEAAPNADGCTELGFNFDDAGNMASRTCLRGGQPANVTGSAVVVDKYEYDARGCLVRHTPLDATGKVVLGDETYVTRHGRDAHCTETSIAYLDDKDKLVSVPTEPSRSEYTLGNEGELEEKRCFGVDDKPSDCSPSATGERSGGSVFRYTYDERGRMLSRRGFDHEGRPRNLSTDLPHEERSTYDDRGLAIEEAYFDPTGKPALAFDTVARTVNRYDDAGELVSFAGFGTDGRPVNDSTMIHELRVTFDSARRSSGIEVYDAKGKPPAQVSLVFEGVAWPDTAARLEIVRDNGFAIENVFFDRNGAVVGRLDCRSRDVVCSR